MNRQSILTIFSKIVCLAGLILLFGTCTMPDIGSDRKLNTAEKLIETDLDGVEGLSGEIEDPAKGSNYRKGTTGFKPVTPPSISHYEQTFLDSGLLDIEEFIPGILVELKYSTTDNFLNYDIYGTLEKCYLRREAAAKLKRALELLQLDHPDLTLLVYDGARPHRVQYEMWEALDTPNKLNYLSPPDKGSVHNYGCAVDLTVADRDGNPLDMGTEFDFFGPLAQPKLEKRMLESGELSQEQYENRLILRKAMEGAGFFNIRTEWWHFNAFGSKTVKHRFTLIH